MIIGTVHNDFCSTDHKPRCVISLWGSGFNHSPPLSDSRQRRINSQLCGTSSSVLIISRWQIRSELFLRDGSQTTPKGDGDRRSLLGSQTHHTADEKSLWFLFVAPSWFKSGLFIDFNWMFDSPATSDVCSTSKQTYLRSHSAFTVLLALVLVVQRKMLKHPKEPIVTTGKSNRGFTLYKQAFHIVIVNRAMSIQTCLLLQTEQRWKQFRRMYCEIWSRWGSAVILSLVEAVKAHVQ